MKHTENTNTRQWIFLHFLLPLRFCSCFKTLFSSRKASKSELVTTQWRGVQYVAAQTARSRCKLAYYPYSLFRPIILGLTKGKRLYMASESLLSCILPFLRHLRNKWPWISRRGHSRSYILAAIESPCTTLYRPLIISLYLQPFRRYCRFYNPPSNCVIK